MSDKQVEDICVAIVCLAALAVMYFVYRRKD